MTSSNDLRTRNNYIVKYSFLFLFIQDVLKFVKNTDVVAQNKAARFLWPTVYI